MRRATGDSSPPLPTKTERETGDQFSLLAAAAAAKFFCAGSSAEGERGPPFSFLFFARQLLFNQSVNKSILRDTKKQWRCLSRLSLSEKEWEKRNSGSRGRTSFFCFFLLSLSLFSLFSFSLVLRLLPHCFFFATVEKRDPLCRRTGRIGSRLEEREKQQQRARASSAPSTTSMSID